MQTFVGTSGFSYATWKNEFYPEKLATSKWLSHYSTRFNTVELNNTFYRFPVARSLASFYDKVPDDFLFTVKAHKIITHSMRLKDARDKAVEYTDIVEEALREKLACILFQLPGSYKYSEENLDRVILSIPNKERNVVEFRDQSWWIPEVFETLRLHNLTFCNVSYPGLPEEMHTTTRITYLRMHGVPDLFRSPYADDELRFVAGSMDTNVEKRFVYFNNTDQRAAYDNAFTLRTYLGSE